MEECVAALKKDIKCRDSLIRDLYLLLTDEPMFQSIFIFGHVSCGKSFIVRKLLKYLKYNVSIVNCLEHTSNRSLFEKILVDLSSFKLSSENGYKFDIRSDNFVDFKNQLELILNEMPESQKKPSVIVLERSEKLRDMNENILPAMMRLGELTKTNICTILTTDVIFARLASKTVSCEPVKVHFPQYSKDELKEILMHLTKPEEYSQEFYYHYLEFFFLTFYRFCRDLGELRYMAKKIFPDYIDPIISKMIDPSDTIALYRNIRKTFKANLEVIYLRMSTEDFDQQSKFSLEIESTKMLALSFELPAFSKYLLIAAFLASYNPPLEDKKIFMKESGPRKKRAYKSQKKPKKSKAHGGPRNFPLNRLLAIFCSIYSDKVDLNALLLTQIPSLCQLGLIGLVGDNDINEPKYKCYINYEFALFISKTISFEMNMYLYDRN
ncbi:origin recognition complex subunit 5 [Copidosoma floridanum]|uniref:origin recognition complex subunit 5 n=1 Tax=Copidosoma floridanum TaxID=29053 RepID=UPI000C6F4ECC|nr:origin recognition complex subunit 5 [Copidosoma floridanum]